MKKSLLPLLIAIAALFSLPLFIHNPYYIHLVETILIYTIFSVWFGYCGGICGPGFLGSCCLIWYRLLHRWCFVLPLRLDDLGHASSLDSSDLYLRWHSSSTGIKGHWTVFSDGDLGFWNHYPDSNPRF